MRLDFFCYFTNTFGQQRGCRKRQCVEPFLKRTGTFSSTMFLSYAPTYQKKQNKENQVTSLRPVSWPSSLSLCRWRPSDEKMATVLGEVPSCQGGDATPRSLVSQRGEKKIIPFFTTSLLTHLLPMILFKWKSRLGTQIVHQGFLDFNSIDTGNMTSSILLEEYFL